MTSRRFELTISDNYPAGVPLPETFNDWVEYLFGFRSIGARTATLERVVEVRHPSASDIVERRKAHSDRARSTGSTRGSIY